MPLPLGGERPKSSESFWPGEKEARRLVVAAGVGGGVFSLLDIGKGVGMDELMKRSRSLLIWGETFGRFLCLPNLTAGRNWGELLNEA